ncbi:MAG: MFS transporter [Candidatus Heimdallarchaeum endolithica]|uniref:MFS transporter n=1 Tax=Candidatus Heimdallarchaeum endolithica TaxID=2876572 RepID=A0A9Y1BRQ4_9ARCH|nr:MAG: MFS transporter [Candidatus Heimdallarchaeum endolithica]
MKISAKTTIAITLLSFAGELAWGVENQYFNVFLYNVIIPDPIYISIMVAASALTATLTSIFFGALSDKIGKRKVFFLIGLPFWALTTAIFPLAGLVRPVILAASLAIVFDCVMTFFGSMSNDAALKAYATDVTTLKNRGRISAVMEFTVLLATLVVYGASGFIIESLGYYYFFYIIGASVGVLGIIGAIIAPEVKIKKTDKKYWETIKTTFSISELRNNRDVFLTLSAAMLWGIAFNVFFPFLIIYMQKHLELSLEESSLLIFVAILIAILISIPVGFIVDKIGRKKIAIISVFIESFSLIFFGLSEKLIFLGLSGVGMMFAMAMWDISSVTWIRDLYPEDKRGQFSGYYIVFTVLAAMGIGPFIGSAIAKTSGKTFIDEFGQIGYIPPPLMFIFAGVLVLTAIIPLLFANEKNRRRQMKQ